MVVTTASALLKSVRQKSMRQADSLSVRMAWSSMDFSTWQGQTSAAPTLALVKALCRAHGDAQGINVLRPNPEEVQQELRRLQSEIKDLGKDRRRGGGGSDGGSGGERGKDGGGGSHRGGSSSQHRRGGGGSKCGGSSGHGGDNSSHHVGVTAPTTAVVEAAERVEMVRQPRWE